MLASNLPNKTLLNGGKEVGVEGGDTVAFLCPGVAFEVGGLATFGPRRPASISGRPKVRMAMPGTKSARKASRNDCTSFATITDTKDVAAVVDSAHTAVDDGGGKWVRLEA